MSRIEMIDRIRKELLRQANKAGPLNFIAKPADGPDMMLLRGTLDVDALARAIRNE